MMTAGTISICLTFSEIVFLEADLLFQVHIQ